jgi:hypothetical protein
MTLRDPRSLPCVCGGARSILLDFCRIMWAVTSVIPSLDMKAQPLQSLYRVPWGFFSSRLILRALSLENTGYDIVSFLSSTS